MEILLHNSSQQLATVHSKRFFKNAFLLYILYYTVGKKMDEHLGRKKTYYVNEPKTQLNNGIKPEVSHKPYETMISSLLWRKSVAP